MAKRKIKKLAGSNPQVGIFWVYQGDIVQFSDPIEMLNPGTVVPSFVDSSYDHVNKWREVVSKYPALRNKEYYDVPRGRVTKVPGGFNLLAPSTIVKNPVLVRQIMRRFDLPPVKTRLQQDTHYENPEISEHELDDDEDTFDTAPVSPAGVRQRVMAKLKSSKKRG